MILFPHLEKSKMLSFFPQKGLQWREDKDYLGYGKKYVPWYCGVALVGQK